MSKFEINDPELRGVILEQIGHARLIAEDAHETARIIHAYIIEHMPGKDTLPEIDQVYLDSFGWFIAVADKEFNSRKTDFIDDLVQNLTPVIEDDSISAKHKTRIVYACGNLFEMNRILIEIGNSMFHSGAELNKMDK